ncbi:hypothetical protein M0804_006744 [Polistes exclamans]|nr:hypothetical protein M0804_006744 [Polistes exclamans]
MPIEFFLARSARHRGGPGPGPEQKVYNRDASIRSKTGSLFRTFDSSKRNVLRAAVAAEATTTAVAVAVAVAVAFAARLFYVLQFLDHRSNYLSFRTRTHAKDEGEEEEEEEEDDDDEEDDDEEDDEEEEAEEAAALLHKSC